ncbi:MAG: hypothetical protein HKO68_19150 [Desulfobacterales bacterium]|nr:hypothetical protein [Desulfobacterales bacterium]
MARSFKFWGFLAFWATQITLILFLVIHIETRGKAWQITKTNLIKANSKVKKENQHLKGQITNLKKLNMNLRKYLEQYENTFLMLKDAAAECYQIESQFSISLPDELNQERFEIRQLYREWLAEKIRWDRYQQDQYKYILENSLEPQVIDSQSLNLENEENMEYFLEIEDALKLHKRLIRDVRSFHDEIKFQKKQSFAQQQYQLYDLKFKLNDPFAREAALADGLLQAMSALSTGIYQQEAVDVLDRVGEEFTRPIRQLYEQLQAAPEAHVPINHNFNIYMVYGKKLIAYSDALVQQSSISLAPSAFGELDFFSRRLSQSLFDLYQVGQSDIISSTHLDLEELERNIYSMD